MNETPKPKRLIDEIDIDKVDSVALRRLIEEVRNDEAASVQRVYDRIHIRHNRS